MLQPSSRQQMPHQALGLSEAQAEPEGCAATGLRHALCMLGRRHGWQRPHRSAARPPPRPY